MINSAMIALGQLKGIGPSFLRSLDYTFIGKDNGTFVDNLHQLLASKGKKFDKDEIATASDIANRIIHESSQLGIRITNFNEPSYPKIILQSRDFPPILFLLGDAQLPSEKVVCSIGTRKPDETGTKIASRLGEYLAENNIPICNGIAEGIDSASINSGNLKSQKVIGVMGCGLDIQKNLATRRIMLDVVNQVLSNGGLLISEYHPGKQIDKFSLIRSCRLQAACAGKLVLVQSKLSGGSRFTVKAAYEYDREIYIVIPPKSFQSDSFEANLFIEKHGDTGLINFIEVGPASKHPSHLDFIYSKDDYKKLIDQVMTD